jgi:hypothetical protein
MPASRSNETRRPKKQVTRRQTGDNTRDLYTAENVGNGSFVIQGYNEVQIQQITNVFQSVPPDIKEQEELARLKTAIPQAAADLRTVIQRESFTEGNPYHLLEALDIHQQDQLAGRDTVVDQLTAHLCERRLTVLTGENGIGKTSLLRAGLIPALVEKGHLPIRIEASSEALDAAVKKAIFGSPESFPLLSSRPMNDALRLAGAFLPKEKNLILLVDNMEEFFDQPSEAQEKFIHLWKDCINDLVPDAHWLFCTDCITHHLTRFQSGEVNPFAAMTVLGPLDPLSARQVIEHPAQAGILRIEEGLIEAVLADLGGSEINPAHLQIICHTLASRTSTNHILLLPDYISAGRADGILQGYLQRAINELPSELRDTAWQVLSILGELHNRPAGAEALADRMRRYGYRHAETKEVIEILEVKNLLARNSDGFRLASNSMLPSIRAWREEQAALKLARQEAARQVQRVRSSALRGLFGGAAGFVLFNEIVYTGPAPPWDYAIFFTIIMISTGGIAGVLLTLFADLARATYHSRRWAQYVVGGASGALAYMIAMFLYVNTIVLSDIPKMIWTLFEGGAWGMAIGIGLIWGLQTRLPIWASVCIIAPICGVVLMGADLLGEALVFQQLSHIASPFRIFLGGMLAPLLYLSAALVHRLDVSRKEMTP